MDFLYKHYEKLVLTICLLCLCLGVLMVAASFNKTRSDLQAGNQKAANDVKGGELVQPIKSDGLGLEIYLNDPRKVVNVLGPELPQDPKQVKDDKASLLFAAQFIVCSNQECRKLIDLRADKCPFCKAEQPELAKNTGEEQDTDEDGIPDLVEQKYSFLNFRNPNDAREDNDNDGFLNIEEIQSETDPGDAESFPPLAMLCRTLRVFRQNLPFKLIEIDRNRTDDQSKWDIAVMCWNPKMRKMRRTATTVGSTVGGFTITKAGFDGANAWIDAHPEKNPKDVYHFVQGQDVPNKNLTVAILYLASRHAADARVLTAKYVQRRTVGEDFRISKMPNAPQYFEMYRLKEVSEKTNVAKLALLQDGKEVKVIEVPPFNREKDFMFEPRKDEDFGGNPDEMMDGPGGMGPRRRGMPPPGRPPRR